MTKAVKYLDQLTGIEWPYLTLSRRLRGERCWVEPFTAPLLAAGLLLASIENVGNGFGAPPLWPPVAASCGGYLLLPPGMAADPLPLISWTDEDFEHAKAFPDQKPFRVRYKS